MRPAATALPRAALVAGSPAVRSAMTLLWPGIGAQVQTRWGTWPLSLSGALPVEAGALGSGTRIEEATQNLIVNPSFETNLGGWDAPGDISRSDAQAKFGTYSMRHDGTGGGADDLLTWRALTLPAVDAYTLSAWAYIPAAWVGTELQVRYNEFGGGNLEALFDVNIRDQWQHASVTETVTDVDGFVDWRGTFTAGNGPVFLDGVQVERKGCATSYCDGSLGTGYAWDGAAHASTSTRAAGALRANPSILSATQGSVAIWIRPDVQIAGYGARVLCNFTVDGDNFMEMGWNGGADFYLINRVLAAGELETAAPASWTGPDFFVVYAWDANTLYLSVDGRDYESMVRSLGVPDLSGGSLYFGTRTAWAHANAVLGPIYTFDRVLTQAEVDVLARMTRPPRWAEVA